MKVGDRIRVFDFYKGTTDYTVEEFRYCLGIFESEQHREAELFTPLCELYEEGPESEQKYISHFGAYTVNKVPAWNNMKLIEKRTVNQACEELQNAIRKMQELTLKDSYNSDSKVLNDILDIHITEVNECLQALKES